MHSINEHMPRSKQHRRVCCNPNFTVYKPSGVQMKTLVQKELTLDEVEAIRLADIENLYHVDAAKQMQVSRQTFGRIISEARHKIAVALLHGHAIKIVNKNNSDDTSPPLTEV